MKLKKIRNALLVVLTLALVSATAVAVTWAYTEDSFKNAENTFGNEEISAKLTEQKWDGDKPTPETPALPENFKYGQNLATSYSPEMHIPKNPSITNISDPDHKTNAEPSEYVAMTVRYYVTDDTTGKTKYYFPGYAEFSAALATVQHYENDTMTTGFNTNDWEEKAGSNGTVFYYKREADNNGIVENWKTTATIFDEVLINGSTALNSPDYYNSGTNKYSYSGLTKVVETTTNGVTTLNTEKNQTFTSDNYPEFHIELQGYAVQAKTSAKNAAGTLENTAIGLNNAKPELDKLIDADPITKALA